jgi:hypothetical protein
VGGATVQPYAPAQATAQQAGANPFEVKPDQTVSGQISNIIASGSPLMQQAEANARNIMNQRGLINSSQGITAGQSALYSAATPIATADAATYAKAATDTTTAQNTAALQNSQLGTQTSQFNAAAGNTSQQAAQQIAGAKDLAAVNNASAQAITNIQSNTSLSIEDKATASQQLIANIQANTNLSVADKNNATAVVVQQMSNASSLANIQANGVINEQVQKMANDNKTLLQTSQGAATFYSQMLANLSNIMTNPNLNTTQQTQALNNGIKQLQDGMAALNSIANNQAATSSLVFTDPTPAPTTSSGVSPSNTLDQNVVNAANGSM